MTFRDAWVNSVVASQYILGLQGGPANGTHRTNAWFVTEMLRKVYELYQRERSEVRAQAHAECTAEQQPGRRGRRDDGGLREQRRAARGLDTMALFPSLLQMANSAQLDEAHRTIGLYK